MYEHGYYKVYKELSPGAEPSTMFYVQLELKKKMVELVPSKLSLRCLHKRCGCSVETLHSRLAFLWHSSKNFLMGL